MINDNRFVGCCGAYCKTCNPFLKGFCKGCKPGFDTADRDIEKARCKIKICCFRDKKLDTCADCTELESCVTIESWFSKNGYKYRKYEQAIRFIKENGYAEFFRIADTWRNAHGRYD